MSTNGFDSTRQKTTCLCWIIVKAFHLSGQHIILSFIWSVDCSDTNELVVILSKKKGKIEKYTEETNFNFYRRLLH